MPFTITPEQYYSATANYGDYQYVSLDEILNNFMLNYVGDDKTINNISRHNVLFHLKRGLQELNYDALKEIKNITLTIGDDLTLILPYDYVNYVRISWLDANGKFRPIIQNTESAMAIDYLQDNQYDILFDGNGFPLQSDNTQVNHSLADTTANLFHAYTCDESVGAEFNINPARANINGAFVIDKRRGLISFTSDIKEKDVVLEYISDGLEYQDSVDIKIHKQAVNAMYAYVSWAILDAKIGVQEYIIRRARKKFVNAKRQTKSRIGGLRYNELLQVIRGKSKWLK